MVDSDYAERVLLALHGLVPVVFMERCVARCQDPHSPTAEELWPEDHEREQVLDTLVMADVLVCPTRACSHKERERRGRSLTALAKALVILSLAEGGVRFLGFRWQFVDGRLEDRREVEPSSPTLVGRKTLEQTALEDF